MILPKSEKTEKRLEIDLNGADGNVFVLISYARRFAKELQLDGMKNRSEMMSGDYENAVATFERYFGEYVILYR